MKTRDIIYDNEIRMRAESSDWCAGIASAVYNRIKTEKRIKIFNAFSIAAPAAAAVVLVLALFFSLSASNADSGKNFLYTSKMIHTDDLFVLMYQEVDQILSYEY